MRKATMETYTKKDLMEIVFMSVRHSTINVSPLIRNVVMRTAFEFVMEKFGDGTNPTKALIISAYETWSGAIYEDSDCCDSDCDEEE